MKGILKFTLFALLSIAMVVPATAQKKKKSKGFEGFVKYEIVDAKGNMQASMLKGSTQTMSFMGDQVVVDMDMMNGMMRTRVITLEDESAVMLMDGMMGKLKINMDMEDAEEQKANLPEVDIKYDKSTTKKIAGYDCYKATMDVEGTEMIMYVTEDFAPKTNPLQNNVKGEFVGFPLRYEINQQGMVMVFEATEVSKKVDPSAFEIPMEGYKEMSMDQFTDMMGSMGGGGF